MNRGSILEIVYGSEKNPRHVTGIVVDDLDTNKLIVLNLLGEIVSIKNASIMNRQNIEDTLDISLVDLLRKYNKEYENQQILKRKVEDLKKKTNLRNVIIADRENKMFDLKNEIKNYVKKYKLTDLIYIFNKNTKILEDVLLKNVSNNIIIELENELNNELIDDENIKNIKSMHKTILEEIEKIEYKKFVINETYESVNKYKDKLLINLSIILNTENDTFYKDEINEYLDDINAVLKILTINKIKEIKENKEIKELVIKEKTDILIV